MKFPWARLLWEIRELRKEVIEKLSTLQEQVTQLESTLDGIGTELGIVGSDVTNLVTEIAALKAANPAVDLAPLQTKAQAIADKLTGIQTAAEAGSTPPTGP